MPRTPQSSSDSPTDAARYGGLVKTLEFFTSDELFEELAERNSGVLLVTRADDGKGAEKKTFWYSGGVAATLGMAIYVEDTLRGR